MTMADPPERLPYLGDENDDIDMSGTSPVEDDAPENVRTDEYDQADTQPQEEETPEAPPAAPDLTATLAQFAELQRQDLEDRRTRDEQARRSAEETRQRETAPKPLAEQPEWQARYEEAMSAMSYDENARRTFMSMNQEMAREETARQMADFRGQMQLEYRATEVVRQSVELSRTQYGDLVSEADFQAVAADVFGMDRANLARALDPQLNPQADATRRLLSEAAAGRALLSGRIQRPPTATPPPNPRGAARNGNPAKAPAKNDMWADSEYVDGMMADLYSGSKK